MERHGGGGERDSIRQAVGAEERPRPRPAVAHELRRQGHRLPGRRRTRDRLVLIAHGIGRQRHGQEHDGRKQGPRSCDPFPSAHTRPPMMLWNSTKGFPVRQGKSGKIPRMSRLSVLYDAITACRRCPRLVAYREEIAHRKTRRFHDWTYWGKPVPGYGDVKARLLIVGLAPAAHGGNRTGRMFTGDRSGDWLFEALHHAGFANQPTSAHAADGLRLRDAYITATIRCAPPDNKPLPTEILACRPYLLDELGLLDRVRVVVGLGRIGWEAYLRARRALGKAPPAARPVFAPGAASDLGDGVTLLACYHPSQQNTFTGKLTRPMLRSVFVAARRLLENDR